MKKITDRIKKQIQDINGDPGLTAADKIAEIKKIKFGAQDVLFQFLNDNYSTGPELAAAIKKLISKNRPKGAKKSVNLSGPKQVNQKKRAKNGKK
jgi:hypothetical protein